MGSHIDGVESCTPGQGEKNTQRPWGGAFLASARMGQEATRLEEG